MSRKLFTSSAKETFAAGTKFSKMLSPGSICAFRGDLGAGKTVFIKGICEGLGVSENVNSPTFNIVNCYESGRLPVYHFDLYRISGIDELRRTGYEEYFYGTGVSLVEWAENAEEAFGKEALQITLKKTGENLREIFI
ncbi:MAG: tRNA (adenosine(37)-N6)-threonylcarbamoyltransferase complex ATPase subunit type 1 TsaE [Fibrobacterota bacterium]